MPQNPVVALLFHVSEHRYTDQFILFCIFVNSCTLALDDPRKVRTRYQIVICLLSYLPSLD